MDERFKVGDTVRFRHPHGSWGIITAKHAHDDGFYVRYQWGKNAFGELMSDLASVQPYEIEAIPRELYNRHVACRAWSDEQKEIQEEFNALRKLQPR